MKEIKSVLKIPCFFISMATAANLSYRFRFLLAYLVPLDVDVTGNITTTICEVWSEFNIFCTLVAMATAVILNLFNSPKGVTHYVDIHAKFHEV